jgi:hypothetical protein
MPATQFKAAHCAPCRAAKRRKALAMRGDRPAGGRQPPEGGQDLDCASTSLRKSAYVIPAFSSCPRKRASRINAPNALLGSRLRGSDDTAVRRVHDIRQFLQRGTRPDFAEETFALLRARRWGHTSPDCPLDELGQRTVTAFLSARSDTRNQPNATKSAVSLGPTARLSAMLYYITLPAALWGSPHALRGRRHWM